MTPEQFAYWLNGFSEMNKAPPTQEQWECIQAHLKTVFTKVTPYSYGIGTLPYGGGVTIC